MQLLLVCKLAAEAIVQERQFKMNAISSVQIFLVSANPLRLTDIKVTLDYPTTAAANWQE